MTLDDLANVKRVFLCGKITGDHGYKLKFGYAANALERAGFAVMNPAILPPEGFEHGQYMKVTLAMLSVCDALFYLSDWDESTGARIEISEATRTGKRIFSFKEWFTEYKKRMVEDAEHE